MRFIKVLKSRKGKPININGLKRRCAKALKGKDIVAIYLLGSYAVSKGHELSDVDIAVLFDKKIPRKNYLKRELELISTFQDLVDDEAIDLGVLNNASLDFQYQVATKGKLIFCSNELERIKFENQAIDYYLDFEPYREEYFKYLRIRAREGKLGVR